MLDITTVGRLQQQLTDRRVWCGWRAAKSHGKTRKVPRHLDGRRFSTKLDTPYTLAEVLAAGYEPGLVLTGRLVIDGKTVVGFDCDACRDPVTGALMPWVEEFIAQHKNSYTEITPSGQGLRLLALVTNPPDGELRKIEADLEAAPNTTKKPEIETFGLGRPCYITVSGDRLPTSSAQPETLRSLDWLTNRYPFVEQEITPELPEGVGDAPELDTIDRLVQAHPEGELLVAGDWETVVPGKTASEGFWRLVKRVVRAARGHGLEAVEYLLTRTAYGAGMVDSAEPDRYRREHWVAAEVGRVDVKAPRTDPEAFGDDYTSSDEMPTEEQIEAAKAAEVERELGIILQVDDFIAAVEGRTWLVDELYPADGLASIFGKPGQGKTPAALLLAVHTASGADTHFGRKMNAHGPVVFFVGEDEAGVRDRVLGQLDAIDPLLRGSDLPLYFTREPGRLIDADNVGAWLARIKAVTGDAAPRLVVVDTLARNFGGGNESSTEDMQAFVDGCGLLSRTLDKCLVLCTHHPSKGNEEAGRGSSTLLGALDTEIKASLVGRSRLILTPTKIKGAGLPEEPLVGTLIPVIVGKKPDGSPRTAITLTDSPPDPAEVFEQATGDETLTLLVKLAELGGEMPGERELAAAVGMGRTALKNRIEALVCAGLVRADSSKNGRRSSYVVTAQGSNAITQAERRATNQKCQLEMVREPTNHDEPSEPRRQNPSEDS